MQRWNGRYPKIHFLPAHHQLDAAVLRQAAFGDIQRRHDFDPRDHRRLQPARRCFHLVQHPVITVAHPEAGFEGVDMDIGGPRFHGLRDQLIDQPDQRCLARQILEPFRIVLSARCGQPDIVQACTRLSLVKPREGAFQVDRHRDHNLHLPVGGQADGRDSEPVQRIGHRDGDDLIR